LEDGSTEGGRAIVEHKWGLFLELMRWAEGGSCRHDAILRYFGDEAETLAGCGRCDVCLVISEGGPDPDAVTLIVRKALSAVARVHRRFGLTAAVKLLRGEDDPRLVRAGLDKTPTFGALREHAEGWLLKLLRRCVTAGWVDFTTGDRPLALLTDDGRAVMRADRPVRLVLPPAAREGGVTRWAAKRGPSTSGPVLEAAAAALFEALRSHRLGLARAQGVPPFMIASDRTLRDIALLGPTTLAELRNAYGIGEAKAERYGAGFLGVVASLRDS
ncbi:MAG: HRDC domain-containing protein, partial [Vicinamibacteria bacterium]